MAEKRHNFTSRRFAKKWKLVNLFQVLIDSSKKRKKSLNCAVHCYKIVDDCWISCWLIYDCVLDNKHNNVGRSITIIEVVVCKRWKIDAALTKKRPTCRQVAGDSIHNLFHWLGTAVGAGYKVVCSIQHRLDMTFVYSIIALLVFLLKVVLRARRSRTRENVNVLSKQVEAIVLAV